MSGNRFSVRPTRAFALGAVAALYLAAAPGSARAQTAADLDPAKGILFIDTAADATDGLLPRFAEAAAAAMARSFASRGVELRPAPELSAPAGAAAAAAEAARAAGARWAVVVRARIEGRSLSWRISIHDARDGTSRAADSFSAFAGLTALPLLDASAESAVAAWTLSKDDAASELPVPYRLTFKGSGQAVSVRFSSATVSPRDAGSTDGGPFEAAYAPFRAGDALSAEVSAEGYWPKTILVKKGPSQKPIQLPLLQRRTERAFAAALETGRLPGFTLSYRSYPAPDRFYLYAENAAWLRLPPDPGSRAVIHDELRAGMALYLNLRPDSPFRFSFGVGLSGIFTYLPDAPEYESPTGFDLCLDPIRFGFEFHRPDWAFVLSQRFPYSLGLESGFLSQGWSRAEDSGPLFLSAGVMLKW